MTKDGFLSKLNFCLMFKVNTKKRKIIMQDYKDFFAEGLAGGESENALCEKFGSPVEIAREVSEGEVNKSLLFSGLALALLFCMLLYLFSYEIAYITKTSYRYIIAITSIIAVLLCAKTTGNVLKKSQAIVTAFLGIAMLTFAAWCVLIFNIFNIKFQAGNILGFGYYFCSVIAAISVYILIINIKNISKKFLVALPCLFYMIFSLCECFTMMGNVTGTDNYLPLQSLMTSALFIAPSLLLSLFFAFRKGKV